MSVLRYPPQVNGLQKSLAAALDTGVTASMTLNNTTSIQNKPGVCVVDRIDSSGALKSVAVREFIAYAATSGATLTTLTRNVDNSSSDQDHAIGAIVEFAPDITWAQAVIDALAILVNPADISIIKMTSPRVVTDISDTNGNELAKVTATASAVNEITLANAATGNNPKITTSGGDTDVGWDIRMKGAGRFRRPTVVELPIGSATASLATGDGQAFFRVPSELNGMNLTGVAAQVYVAGTTNTLDVQIHRTRSATPTDMLSTKITIDSTEVDTSTAAAAAVIDTGNDDVATGDLIAIDIDAVHSTPAKGLIVEMRFELP